MLSDRAAYLARNLTLQLTGQQTGVLRTMLFHRCSDVHTQESAVVMYAARAVGIVEPRRY